MTTEEKIKGLEHLLRKCPDVISVVDKAGGGTLRTASKEA